MIPEGLQAYVEQQQLLLNVTRQIASSAGLNEIIPHILEGIERAIRPDVVRLLLTGTGGRWRAFDAGSQANEVSEMTPVDWSVLEMVGQQGEVEFSRSAASVQEDHSLFLPAELDTLIAVPARSPRHAARCFVAGVPARRICWAMPNAPICISWPGRRLSPLRMRSHLSRRGAGREWLAAILASTPDPVLVVDRESTLATG